MIYPHLTPDDHPALAALDTGTQVPTIWDPRYVVRAAPLTSTTKAGRVVEAHTADLALITPPLDDLRPVWQDIEAWHAPLYVRAVRDGWPRRLAEAQGFYWSRPFGESVARIWAGQHVAQRLAHILGQPVLHPVSGAHHATPNRGGGFCTFNYAVAGLALVQRDRPTSARIAVIDLDAHYGNGTRAFQVTHPALDLHIFDIHGGADEREKRPGVFAVKDAAAYRDALQTLPEWLRKHQITDAVYLAGVDPHTADPVGGIDGVTTEFLAARDLYVLRALQLAGVSTVVNFAGGYIPEKVVELHGNTIKAIQQVNGAGAATALRALDVTL